MECALVRAALSASLSTVSKETDQPSGDRRRRLERSEGRGKLSSRVWKAFFPKAKIYSIDIVDKSALEEPRIRIFRGSQGDPDFLRLVAKEVGHLDIIIDDGSHINEHVITSFETLWHVTVPGR